MLVDAGVPRPVRELLPVVVADDGHVVWVPGYVADETALRAGRRSPRSQLRLARAADT
ncbi:MAG: tRNA lysidine(34) synthetase TilS C-terminal domain-containing protein [Bradymonadaceae bacterium]